MILYFNCLGISGGNPNTPLTVRLPCVSKHYNQPKQPTAVTTVKLASSIPYIFASNPSTTVSSSGKTIAKLVVTHVGLNLSKLSKNTSNSFFFAYLTLNELFSKYFSD